MAAPAFVELLNTQIGNEFAAHQQYVACAVYFDELTMPRTAQLFFDQALEEREHAMMMVKYLLDSDAPVRIPGIPAPVNEFADVVAPVALALEQEKRVTEQINALIGVARAGERLRLGPVHAVVHQGADRGGQQDEATCSPS
jgi:ferritin